jgi:hypothetical protein
MIVGEREEYSLAVTLGARRAPARADPSIRETDPAMDGFSEAADRESEPSV